MAGLRSYKKIDGVIALFLIILVLKMITSGLLRPHPRSPDDEENGFIQIEGDVKYPGVYGFKGRDSLKALIRKAGGLQPLPFEPEAETASEIHSGEQIVARYDRGKYHFQKGEMPSFYKITMGIPISLNEESEAGLSAIPGIGPQLAENIVKMRSQRGGFKSLDELLTVKGVGRDLYSKIKMFLIVRQVSGKAGS